MCNQCNHSYYHNFRFPTSYYDFSFFKTTLFMNVAIIDFIMKSMLAMLTNIFLHSSTSFCLCIISDGITLSLRDLSCTLKCSPIPPWLCIFCWHLCSILQCCWLYFSNLWWTSESNDESLRWYRSGHSSLRRGKIISMKIGTDYHNRILGQCS